MSVIVPVYNVQEFLARCLQSIVLQTYDNLEILVVDDGSTDQSPAVARNWADIDSRINVITKANGGLSDARNTALDHCRGEFVTMVDSDDFIAPTLVETLLGILNQNPRADIACCQWQQVDDPARWKPVEGTKQVTTLEARQALSDIFYQRSFINHSACAKLYRRRLFDSVRYPVGKLYEDLAVVLDIFGQCDQVAVSHDVMYAYHQRKGSITHDFKPERADVLDILLEMEWKVDDDLRPAVQSRLMSACFNMLRLMPRDDKRYADLQQRCYGHIKRLRSQTLRDSNVRARNRLAASMSYLVGLKNTQQVISRINPNRSLDR